MKSGKGRKRGWRYVLWFFIIFLLYHILLSGFFPSDNAGYIMAPDWYVPVGFFVAIVGTIAIINRKELFATFKRKNKEITVDVDDLSEWEKWKVEKASQKAKIKSTFFDIDDVKTEGTFLCGVIDDKYGTLRSTIQSCLKLETELIEIGFVNGCCEKCAKYRNRIYSITGNDNRFPKFPRDFHFDCGLHPGPFVEGIMEPTFDAPNYIAYSNRPFVDDRTEFDMQGYQKRLELTEKHLASKTKPTQKKPANIIYKVDVNKIIKDEENWRREQRGLSPIEYELDKIDHMEGHDFERWCAELLRKNGFTDVSVTQGSGDQGVDVLAKKDGIKYAVQCKCYSSGLGNTPVQEVHAGKSFYGCQVGAVMTNRRFTKGAQELAEKTGVLLWDRDKLVEMLK